MQDLLSQITLDELSINTIIINLSVGVVLSLILKLHFEKFSSTLSGKRELARVLPFLVLIVCLIISIVKSSLALSLGLVGALSIVRFRTPIKEPEELVYLFMAIAIGLGLGANQTVLTTVTSIFILAVVALIKWRFNQIDSKNLYISLTANEEINASEIANLVAENVNKADLKRYDVSGNNSELIFFLDILSANQIFDLTDKIKEKFPNLELSVIDQSRIPGL